MLCDKKKIIFSEFIWEYLLKHTLTMEKYFMIQLISEVITFFGIYLA